MLKHIAIRQYNKLYGKIPPNYELIGWEPKGPVLTAKKEKNDTKHDSTTEENAGESCFYWSDWGFYDD